MQKSSLKLISIIEIIGFTERDRVRYIIEVFKEEPELHEIFLKYMFLIPHIKSMMYIPLNCAIIARVYRESQTSCPLALPRTRTQLYEALTHCLLVRYMPAKQKYTSILPEGLNIEDLKKFKILAKFAFDSYCAKSRKVTFFKEDIPKGLVHFGFMNESTEMYATKGVEHTFSFLHLSLQEYLAAWHLANNYSIEFQVAYHWLAKNADVGDSNQALSKYKGDKKDEAALLSQVRERKQSLVEPAIFLAGITGWKYPSDCGQYLWETYLSHDTASIKDLRLLVRSLYEAQNPSLLSHYFCVGYSRKNVSIDSFISPYDCYALSYCVANSSNILDISVVIKDNDNLIHVECFVKGLKDHCQSIKPRVHTVKLSSITNSEKKSNQHCFWLKETIMCLSETKELFFDSSFLTSALNHTFLKSLNKLEKLTLFVKSPKSWEWLSSLSSLINLKVLHISSTVKQSPPPKEYLFTLLQTSLSEAILDLQLPSRAIHTLSNSSDALNKCIVQSHSKYYSQISEILLSGISRETMVGIHSILLRCPSLAILELQRSKLGYDGILFICTALKSNKTLKYLGINDCQLPRAKMTDKTLWPGQLNHEFSSFIFREGFTVPCKTNSTEFLLELNNILQKNTTLREFKVQSGSFLPLSSGGGGEYCQWTGLGPLQQFNVGAVASGISPNLRRSFSSSDLTQPQTHLLWTKNVHRVVPIGKMLPKEIDFKTLFLAKKAVRVPVFSLPSFTAPDCDILQSFSALDYRLKECLEVSCTKHQQEYMEGLRDSLLPIWQQVSHNIKCIEEIVSIRQKREIVCTLFDGSVHNCWKNRHEVLHTLFMSSQMINR